MPFSHSRLWTWEAVIVILFDAGSWAGFGLLYGLATGSFSPEVQRIEAGSEKRRPLGETREQARKRNLEETYPAFERAV